MKQVSGKHTADAARGFTLIEIVITVVILGAVAGILVPFFNAITHSPDPVIRERAISLGQAMMDEIMAKRWDENTPMGGGPICTGESDSQATRPSLIDACVTVATPALTLGPDGVAPATEVRGDFDDVDDYNGMVEDGTFTDPTDSTKTFTMANYRRQVEVGYIASNSTQIDQNTPFITGATTDTKLVVVRITSPLGETFNFVAVACNL